MMCYATNTGVSFGLLQADIKEIPSNIPYETYYHASWMYFYNFFCWRGVLDTHLQLSPFDLQTFIIFLLQIKCKLFILFYFYKRKNLQITAKHT